MTVYLDDGGDRQLVGRADVPEDSGPVCRQAHGGAR